MNADTIIDAIGDIDEELFDRSAKNLRTAAPKTEKRALGFNRKHVLRIAIAAALALVIGVGLMITTGAKGDVLPPARWGINDAGRTQFWDDIEAAPAEAAKDPVKAWMEPAEIPADAVFAPVRKPNGQAHGCSNTEYFLGFVSAFEKADAVCLVTVEDWLSECMFCTFFEASVDKVYKGELPEKIVLRQEANSSFSMYNTPLFTYGNKLLVFLNVWDDWDEGVQRHENAYVMMTYGTGYLFYAQDKAGNDYLIDQVGEISSATREKKEAKLTDQYSTELISELIEYIDKQDGELAKSIELFTHDTDRLQNVPQGAPMRVYSFEDMDELLNDLIKGE